MIEAYQKKGELKTNLDSSMTAEIMTGLSIFLGKRLGEGAQSSMEEIISSIDQLLTILMTGVLR